MQAPHRTAVVGMLIVGVAVFMATGCARRSTASPAGSETGRSPATSAASSAGASPSADLVVLGRVLTMDDPPLADALFIDDGIVVAVGSRDEVLAIAGDDVTVMDIGQHVAYPGFIDAHAHWIGDRHYYGLDTPAAAMDAAVTRGWTSISEQWVDADRLAELTALAADGALTLRVDAYLTLNEVQPGGAHFGDWYASHDPGLVDDRLRVQGVKIHLDVDWGASMLWEPADLTATIGRADKAGWQVSVHTVTGEAEELVIAAFEAALGPNGPNPLHHRSSTRSR